MRVLNSMVASIEWYLRIVKKFITFKPLWTYAVITLLLLSQIAVLVAFVLPMKVIILLGTATIPTYFPDPMVAVGREKLIISLSLVAVVFYLLHVGANKLSAGLVVAYANRLLVQSGKTKTYRAINSSAKSSYDQITRSLSGVVFFVVSFSGVWWFYPNLAILFVCYLALVIMFMLFFYEKLAAANKQLSEMMNVVSALGFLTCFGFVVTDFLLPIAPPSLFIALITFILTRQILAIGTQAIATIDRLNLSKVKIAELFYEGYSSGTVKESKRSVFNTLASINERAEWLSALVVEICEEDVIYQSSVWVESGVRGVMAFEVITSDTQHDELGYLYFKVFDRYRTNLALEESTLLSECELSDFAAEYLGQTEVQGYICHVFSLDELAPVKQLVKAQHRLSGLLMETQLPNSFFDSYARTHPFLWQRLERDVVDQLRSFASEKDQEILTTFGTVFPELISVLEKLPCQIVLGAISSEMMRVNSAAEPRVLSFPNWKVEPVGYGLSSKERDREAVLNAIVEAKNTRSELESLHQSSFLLSSVVAQFENNFNAERYTQSFIYIPLIIEYLNDIKRTVKT